MLLPHRREHSTAGLFDIVDHNVSYVEVVRVARSHISAGDSTAKNRGDPAPDDLVNSSEKGGIFHCDELVRINQY